MFKHSHKYLSLLLFSANLPLIYATDQLVVANADNKSNIFVVHNESVTTSYTLNGQFSDGYYIPSKLIKSITGLYYGVTSTGGNGTCLDNGESGVNVGCGVLFSFNATNSTYTKLYDFQKSVGYGPVYLTQGEPGALITYIFGVSIWGGTGISNDGFGYGTIFGYDVINGGDPQIMFSFTNPLTQGAYPMNITLAPDGNYYGITKGGGVNGAGVIFQFNPYQSSFRKIYDLPYFPNFSNANNRININPENFKIYFSNSATSTISYNPWYGNINSLDLTGSNFNTIYNFQTQGNGASNYPLGQLTFDTQGNIYGVTGYTSLDNTYGSIYTMDKNGNNYKTLYQFTAATGDFPSALVLGKDHILYGIACTDRTRTQEEVFSINTDGTNFQRIITFNSWPTQDPLALIQ